MRVAGYYWVNDGHAWLIAFYAGPEGAFWRYSGQRRFPATDDRWLIIEDANGPIIRSGGGALVDVSHDEALRTGKANGH